MFPSGAAEHPVCSPFYTNVTTRSPNDTESMSAKKTMTSIDLRDHFALAPKAISENANSIVSRQWSYLRRVAAQHGNLPWCSHLLCSRPRREKGNSEKDFGKNGRPLPAARSHCRNPHSQQAGGSPSFTDFHRQNAASYTGKDESSECPSHEYFRVTCQNPIVLFRVSTSKWTFSRGSPCFSNCHTKDAVTTARMRFQYLVLHLSRLEGRKALR